MNLDNFLVTYNVVKYADRKGNEQRLSGAKVRLAGDKLGIVLGL